VDAAQPPAEPQPPEPPPAEPPPVEAHAEAPSLEAELPAEPEPLEPPSQESLPAEPGAVLPDAPAGEDPHATQAYEIPGVPPEDPAPVPPRGLPEPPPRVRPSRERPMRRAFRREAAAGGAAPAGASVGTNRRRTGRGHGARLAALVALLAVAAALVLLVHSLKGNSTTKAPPATPVVKVLVPEGKNRLQIAQIARAAGLTGSYRAAAKHSDLLNPVRYGAPHGTPDLEGFLFPATYDMDRGAPASRLVEEQLTAFQENFSAEDVSRAKALGVTPYELLTVASMVEREAQVPADRAKIAAVIYNRLKAGMPLGIDASTYYAVEMEKNLPTYTHELTESQLRINSPYNTRTHTGLPPTPISNPGTASIQAAAHPAHVSYTYYVAGADGCGEQVFSNTQAAFEANVAAYEAAKQKNGGHPPACKHK
jgi:cell division protein YceG involved in septum cleavage